jgi:tetratricopeptide (TPR) repeat protein
MKVVWRKSGYGFTAGSLVLITSRRRLAALEEATPISLDMLSPNEAADLFNRLVSRRVSEPKAVAEIIRLCGYLPLAIRLIAGALRRHPAWTAADLAADLAAAKDRLATMRAENLSVAAAFDLSYADLTPEQQRLFRRLGLYPGTTIDAYAAASLDGTNLATARRNLDDLYDHHFISEPSRGRYRMHDLLAEHARTLAATDPAEDRDQTIGRLLDYYLYAATEANRLIARHTSAATPAVSSPPTEIPPWPTAEETMAWLEAELANMQACWEYAVAHAWSSHAVWIPAQLGEFLRTRGQRDQTLAMHRSGLTVAEAIDDWAGQAANLANLGDAQYLANDYPAATASLTRAIDLYRELGDRSGLAAALLALGLVEIHTDRYSASAEALTEALSLYRTLGDIPGQARTLGYLGNLHSALCDYPASEASFEAALAIFRTLGDRQGQAAVLRGLGRLQRYTGDYDSAMTSLSASLTLHRELGDRLGAGSALEHLGGVQRLTGDYAAAASSLGEALDLFTDLGIRHACAGIFIEFGALQHAIGDHVAEESLGRALELCREVGDRQGQAETLNHLGGLLADTAGPGLALARYTEALTLADDIGARLDEADALEGIGRCALQTGDTEHGLDYLRQALQIYQQIGTPGAARIQQILDQHSQ